MNNLDILDVAKINYVLANTYIIKTEEKPIRSIWHDEKYKIPKNAYETNALTEVHAAYGDVADINENNLFFVLKYLTELSSEKLQTELNLFKTVLCH